MRRLIDVTIRVPHLHHNLHLSKAHIQWWLCFACKWNGMSFIIDRAPMDPITGIPTFHRCQPPRLWMLLARSLAQQDLGQTPNEVQPPMVRALCHPHIAASAWGSQWLGKRLLVHAVVDIWGSGTCKQVVISIDKVIMWLWLRQVPCWSGIIQWLQFQ